METIVLTKLQFALLLYIAAWAGYLVGRKKKTGENNDHQDEESKED